MSVPQEGPPPNANNQDPSHPEGYLQPGYFNLDAMSDEYIVAMGCGFEWGAKPVGGNSEDDLKTALKADKLALLLEHLGADIAVMATTTNPERGRVLMTSLAESDDVPETNIAAAAALPLALWGDYEFGRDTLLKAHQASYYADGYSLARDAIRRLGELLRAYDRHDQADDLDRRWDARAPGE